MNKEDLTRYLTNLQILALRNDGDRLRLEGHENIFNPHHAFDPVPLKIISTYLQVHPERADNLVERMRHPFVFDADVRDWFRALPATEQIEREQKSLRGSVGHYPNGRDAYEACMALDWLVLHPATFPPEDHVRFRALGIPQGNLLDLRVATTVYFLMNSTPGFSYVEGVPFLAKGELQEKNPTNITYTLITEEHGPLDFSIPAFQARGAISVRKLANRYDTGVKRVLVDLLDQPQNPLRDRFEPKDVGILLYSLEREDGIALRVFHEAGHIVSKDDPLSKVPDAGEYLAEKGAYALIMGHPDKRRLLIAKHMDLAVKRRIPTVGQNLHAIYARAYDEDRPDHALQRYAEITSTYLEAGWLPDEIHPQLR